MLFDSYLLVFSFSYGSMLGPFEVIAYFVKWATEFHKIGRLGSLQEMDNVLDCDRSV